MNWCRFFQETLLTYIPTIVTAIVAVTGSVLLYKASTKELRLKKAERLQKQLNDFYYPFALRLKQNTTIRALFDDKDAEDYRMLTELLKGEEFKGNDKALLEEIKKNNTVLNDLILKNQSEVDSELSNDLAKLSSHYTFFILACDGKLSNEESRFKDYVYPTDVNDKIDDKIEKIEKMIERLTK